MKIFNIYSIFQNEILDIIYNIDYLFFVKKLVFNYTHLSIFEKIVSIIFL